MTPHPTYLSILLYFWYLVDHVKAEIQTEDQHECTPCAYKYTNKRVNKNVLQEIKILSVLCVVTQLQQMTPSVNTESEGKIIENNIVAV